MSNNDAIMSQAIDKARNFYFQMASIGLPVMLMFVTFLFNRIDDLESRMYDLRAEAVTENKLAQVENRIMKYMDVRLTDLDNKLQLIISKLPEKR